MNQMASFALAVALGLLAGACGGGKDGKPMVDHPIYEYQPPADIEDSDDATAPDDDDTGDDDSGDDTADE